MSVVLCSAWGGVASPAGFVQKQHETAPESGPDQIEQIGRLDRLARQGDVEAVVEMLAKSESRTVRTTAAVMLSGFRGPDAKRALTRALRDSSDLWIKTAAIQALAYSGGEESEAIIREAAGTVGMQEKQLADQVALALERARPGKPVAFVSLTRGTGSARRQPGWASVDSQPGWHSFWAEHRPAEAPPEVDFSKEIVLAFFQPVREDGADGVEIVGVEEKPEFLRVLVRRSGPVPAPVQDPSKLSFHIVRIPRTALTVHWVQIDQT
jgi:hypothetical protein